MNNNLQNPLQVLNAKSKAGWSGCIEIEEPQDVSSGWNVYLLQGKIQYISSTSGQQDRLDYLWQKFKLGSQCPQLDKETSEYVHLCNILAEKELSEVDTKKVIYKFCREGLSNILSIDQASIQFVPARRINKAIISFSLDKLGAKLEEQVKKMKYLRGYINGPFSRLYLEQKNALKFYQIWKPKYATPELAEISESHKLSTFVSLFVAKSSLYQIATKVNTDLFFLGRHLQQSIAEDLISILPFKELSQEELRLKNQLKESNTAQSDTNSASTTSKVKADSTNSSTLIVCIDDSKTVQRQVKMTLEAGGYQVMSILDPTSALKQLSQRKPTVIFMDINMPNLNGYDLCSLLRKSQRFKDIPIVMLTGRDGMIDRVRAKIVGATDYLTKPCDPNKLIALTKALEKSAVTTA